MSQGKTLRIALVEGSQSPPQFIMNLANGLQHQGNEIAVFGKSYGRKDKKGIYKTIPTDHTRFNKIKLLWSILILSLKMPRNLKVALNNVPLSGNKYLAIKRIAWMLKLLHFNPDIVHFQWVAHILAYDFILKSNLFKIAVSLRGTQINIDPIVSDELKSNYLKFFPYIDGFHTVSQTIANKARDFYKVHPEKIKVIYSFIPEKVSQEFDPEFNGDARQSFRILSVGRFHWIKGYIYALDAIAKFKRKVPAGSFKYTIVAEGEVPSEILYQIQDLELNDCVEIINGLPHAGVVSLMKRCSVLVLSSIEEGIANVVLEAMAVGLPVISTDCGGMHEVITSTEIGRLVPKCNADKLSSALLDFVRLKEEDIRQMRIQARKRIEIDFMQTTQIAKFIAFYQSMLYSK